METKLIGRTISVNNIRSIFENENSTWLRFENIRFATKQTFSRQYYMLHSYFKKHMISYTILSLLDKEIYLFQNQNYDQMFSVLT